MDNRITKKRLKQLLSYDLFKLIVFIVIGIIIWSLLFTMLGDSLDEGQSLNVYAYNVNVYGEELDTLLEGENSDYRSYDVMETSFYSFGAYNASDTAVAQQFTAWSSVGQLDLMFISSANDLVNKTTGEDGKEIETKYSLSSQYSAYFYVLDEFVSDAIEYCKAYGGYGEDGTADTAKAESYFYKRKKGDNFLRHGMISAEQEVERFAKIWQYANKMKYLLESELDIWYTEKDADGKEYRLGIDMGKLYKQGANPTTKKSAANVCSYSTKNVEEGGSTADGVALCAFNNSAHQSDLVYESLGFIVSVIENYSACLVGYTA